MRFLSTKVHGLLDYLGGITIVLSPFLFWTTAMEADLWVPVIMGAALILVSVWTDYEWGAFKSISMRSHLAIDTIAGVLLAASPWLFGFADVVYWPFVIFGLFEIGSALITKKEPGRRGKLGPATL